MANTFHGGIECNVPAQISFKLLQISASSEHRSQPSLFKMLFSSLPYLPYFYLILSKETPSALLYSWAWKKKVENVFCIFNRIKTSSISVLLELTMIIMNCWMRFFFHLWLKCKWKSKQEQVLWLVQKYEIIYPGELESCETNNMPIGSASVKQTKSDSSSASCTHNALRLITPDYKV